jgi:anthranilate/para-aminobenzoate synthase component II
MLLIITRSKPNNVNVNQLAHLCKTLASRQIPYKIVGKCDPAITRRTDICGLIFPGAKFRIHPEEPQDALELELYYLFHFPKLPVLGICHGCQFLMTYYGGDLISYDSYWNKYVKVELSGHPIFRCKEDSRFLDGYVNFHDLPVITPRAKKAGVREIAWFTKFRDGQRHAAAFEFEKGRVYGFMFHPEAKKETYAILYNFYDNVCMAASSASSTSAVSSSATS